MTIVRKCPNCREYFQVEPMSLKFFCDKRECQNSDRRKYIFYHIKNTRGIASGRFDIWDNERVISENYFEMVCRYCGAELRTKKGNYSHSLRYCKDHRGFGYTLFSKYNWSACSYNYKSKVSKKQDLRIIESLGKISKDDIELIDKYKKRGSLIMCEECGVLCNFFSPYRENEYGTINVHHKKPVHTLSLNELNLIWDHDNLIALCEDCHHEKHKATEKPVVDMFENFKKITEFI